MPHPLDKNFNEKNCIVLALELMNRFAGNAKYKGNSHFWIRESCVSRILLTKTRTKRGRYDNILLFSQDICLGDLNYCTK